MKLLIAIIVASGDALVKPDINLAACEQLLDRSCVEVDATVRNVARVVDLYTRAIEVVGEDRHGDCRALDLVTAFLDNRDEMRVIESVGSNCSVQQTEIAFQRVVDELAESIKAAQLEILARVLADVRVKESESIRAMALERAEPHVTAALAEHKRRVERAEKRFGVLRRAVNYMLSKPASLADLAPHTAEMKRVLELMGAAEDAEVDTARAAVFAHWRHLRDNHGLSDGDIGNLCLEFRRMMFAPDANDARLTKFRALMDQHSEIEKELETVIGIRFRLNTRHVVWTPPTSA